VVQRNRRLPCKPSTFKRSLLAVTLIIALGAGYAKLRRALAISPAEALAAPVAATTPAALPRSGVTLPDFSAIVERSGPAVVNISVSGPRKDGGDDRPDDPMFEFFRRFGLPTRTARGRRRAAWGRASSSARTG
jgi:serine protease Do